MRALKTRQIERPVPVRRVDWLDQVRFALADTGPECLDSIQIESALGKVLYVAIEFFETRKRTTAMLPRSLASRDFGARANRLRAAIEVVVGELLEIDRAGAVAISAHLSSAHAESLRYRPDDRPALEILDRFLQSKPGLSVEPILETVESGRRLSEHFQSYANAPVRIAPRPTLTAQRRNYVAGLMQAFLGCRGELMKDARIGRADANYSPLLNFLKAAVTPMAESQGEFPIWVPHGTLRQDATAIRNAARRGDETLVR